MISYTGEKCSHCIKCIQSCPTQAISLIKKEIQIDESKCIHCDICVKNCKNRYLKVESVHMNETLHLHDYNIILIPTSLLSDCKSLEDFEKTCSAIKKLGFDEVIQYSDVESTLYQDYISYSESHPGLWLTSFCPTMNLYIEKEYPTLYERILPFDYPVEVAAKKIREKFKDQNIGIYSLCECVGKMFLAKQPHNNHKSQIDYAMSVSHIFPKIRKLLSDDQETMTLFKGGLSLNVSDNFRGDHCCIAATEGINQATSLLELIEFGRIKHLNLIALYACYQGCIGGYYLWNNPFEGFYNIESMQNEFQEGSASIDDQLKYIERLVDEKSVESFEERLKWFNQVNEVLEKLPQFDCGACGFANCRGLAESIVNHERTLETCRVNKR